jgi:hypothetical protein
MNLSSARRTAALLLAAGAFVSFASAPAFAADAPRFAWGKAGISYDDYRSEAYECALEGLGAEVEDTEPVQRLRQATQEMEALDARQNISSSSDPLAAGVRHAQDLEAARLAARPEQQIRAVKQVIYAAIQDCMVSRGFTRFALTEEQRGEMKQLADGSEERREYLHRLASDATILERQQQPLPRG